MSVPNPYSAPATPAAKPLACSAMSLSVSYPDHRKWMSISRMLRTILLSFVYNCSRPVWSRPDTGS